MAISQRYESYLRHFGRTLTCGEFASNTDSSAVALRHDVDYDIDVALEMARYEFDRQRSATYFVLHSAPYWNDPQLVGKLLQLQDYNHEVGLHVNLLSEWMSGTIDDLDQRLAELLSPLREAGVRISGMSAHGDRLCYEAGFINYWGFGELRPEDPERTEDERTAEGPIALDRDKRVRYPAGHALERKDGKRFPLWSISMREAGIEYDAWHLGKDGYFSDSGGSWSRTSDPLQSDLSTGRHQVLVHPIHWIGQPRTYFFLSAARSGSKWLSQFLDAATPLSTRHEYMLNHDFYEGRSPDKATGGDFAQLADDKGKVTRLIAEGWSRREEIKADYAEVNVYLEAFSGILRDYYPDATFVALRRDPQAVVRSLLSRGWYDTPDDPRHRRVDIADWEACGQFERVCHYVADVNRRLEKSAQYSMRLEDVSADLPTLIHLLEEMGIVVHPRLAAKVHGEVVNATGTHEFPQFNEWDVGQKTAYARICGDIAQRAGYGNLASRLKAWVQRRLAAPFQRQPNQRLTPPLSFRQILLKGDDVPDGSRWRLNGLLLDRDQDSAPLLRPDPAKAGSHRNCVFGGSSWQNCEKLTGWANASGNYLAGSFRAAPSDDGRATLFALSYDASGKLIHQRQLGVISKGKERIEFACRLRADAARFDVGLYASKDSVPKELSVKGVEIRLESLSEGYSAHS